jgi:hypothetical protein
MSQTDVNKIVPASGQINVPVRGEFVFFKTGASRVRVTIHDESVVMEPGDVRRVTKPFSGFEMTNLSGIDQAVELVVGFGEYNRLVVRGEISSFSSVLGSDGVARLDTRKRISYDIGLTVADPKTFTYLGDTGQFNVALQTGGKAIRQTAILPNGNVLALFQDGLFYLGEFSRLDGTQIGSRSSGFTQAPSAIEHHPTFGNLIKRFSGELCQADGIEFVELPEGYLDISGRSYYPDGSVISFTGGVNPKVRLFNSLYASASVIELESSQYPTLGGIDVIADPLNYGSVLINPGSSGQTVKRFNLFTKVIEDTGATGFNANNRIRYNHQLKQFYKINLESGSPGIIRTLSSIDGKFFGRGMVTKSGNARIKKGNYSKEIPNRGDQFFYDEDSNTLRADIIRIIADDRYQDAGQLAAPDNYLDYVHAIEIDGEALENTGPSSFQRAGILDEFTINNPSRVTIEITDELEP